MARNVASWKVLVAGLSVLVAGCASGPGRPAASGQPVDECAQLMADPRIDPIRDKVAVPITLGASQDIAVLSNRNRPTDAERPAIKALWDAHEACRAWTEARSGSEPGYRVLSNEAVGTLLGDLHDGVITYGQFARKLLYIGAQDRSARERLDEELEARARWKLMDDDGKR
jgi:hypothetical protein